MAKDRLYDDFSKLAKIIRMAIPYICDWLPEATLQETIAQSLSDILILCLKGFE